MLSLLKKNFTNFFIAILITIGIMLLYSCKQIFSEMDKGDPSQTFITSVRSILIIGIVFLMMGVGILMCERNCKDCKIISFTDDTQNYYIISSLLISILGFYLGYTIKNEKMGPDSIYWGNLISITMFISTLICSYFIFNKYKSQITSKYKSLKKDSTSNFDYDEEDDDFSFMNDSDSDSGDESDFGTPPKDGAISGTFGNLPNLPGTQNNTIIKTQTVAELAEQEKVRVREDQAFNEMLDNMLDNISNDRD